MTAASERVRQLISPLRRGREAIGNRWGSREKSAEELFDRVRDLLNWMNTESTAIATAKKHIPWAKQLSFKRIVQGEETTLTITRIRWAYQDLLRRREDSIILTSHKKNGISITGESRHYLGHKQASRAPFEPSHMDLFRSNRAISTYMKSVGTPRL